MAIEPRIKLTAMFEKLVSDGAEYLYNCRKSHSEENHTDAQRYSEKITALERIVDFMGVSNDHFWQCISEKCREKEAEQE